MDQKTYYRHSGYPGGLKSMTLRELMDKVPNRALKLAIKGMLPKGPLGRRMFKKLKVYAGADHPHQAQQPQILELRLAGILKAPRANIDQASFAERTV